MLLLDMSFLGEFFAWMAGALAILFALLTSIAVIFAAITTWYGFKYRRDANLSLRKDYHIAISETYNKFISNLDNEEEMINESYDLKLLGYFSSPLSQKRRGMRINFGKTTNTKMRNFVINQFKNWESIEDDFYIKKNLKFNDFAKKMGLIEEEITDKNELVKILTLLNIALLTDSIHMIKNTGKYEKLVNFIISFNSLSPKRTRRLVVNLTNSNKTKEEKQEELDKFKSEIETIVDEKNEQEIEQNDSFDLDTNEKLIDSLEKDDITASISKDDIKDDVETADKKEEKK